MTASITSRSYKPSPSTKVAFLGLGTMGYPMAGHLAMAGHQVTAYNRTASKAQAWAEEFPAAIRPQRHAKPSRAHAWCFAA